LQRPAVRKTAVPSDSFLEKAFPRIDYADAYRGEIHSAGPVRLDELFPGFIRATPSWIAFLMRVRNRLAGILGLKTGEEEDCPRRESFRGQKGDSRGLFEVLEKTDREAVMGKDDRHLDFRVSVHLDPLPGSAPYAYALTLSTTVIFHNRFGKLYFALVKPFHKMIVPAMMRSIIRNLEGAVAAEKTARDGSVNPLREP
jgi:hypothetical protein